jgi:hypothetical protein
MIIFFVGGGSWPGKRGMGDQSFQDEMGIV